MFLFLNINSALEIFFSANGKSVINNHIFHNATGFAVSVDEDQDRLPTLHCLPKLHIKTYKTRLILILAHARLLNCQIANLLSYSYQKSCFGAHVYVSNFRNG